MAEGEMDGRRQTMTAEQITARLRANRRVEEVEAAAGGAGGLRGGDRLLEELYRRWGPRVIVLIPVNM